MLQLRPGRFFFFHLAEFCTSICLISACRSDCGVYEACETCVTPGNLVYANSRATTHANDYAIDPLVNPNGSLLTGDTFAAGAAYIDGNAYPTAPNPYAWAHTPQSNNNAFAPLINPNLIPLTQGNFVAGTGYHDGNAYPTAPNPYAWAHTPQSNNNASVPLINSNLMPLTQGNLVAGAGYHDGIHVSTAPGQHSWGSAAATENMASSGGPGFQYPDPLLSMMSPFADVTNAIGENYHGNYYQDQFSAPAFDVQLGPAVQAPTASHVAGNAPAPLALAPPAVQRHTCATCDKSFSRKADLERHARVHQPNSKVHHCPHAGCGYSYHRKDKVDEHARRPH